MSARISLCMIVKNEEAVLPACLDAAKDWVDEIVVVDTGSTDGTRGVARRYGAALIEWAWRDDFAAARHAGRTASSFFTIMQSEMRALIAHVLRRRHRRGPVRRGGRGEIGRAHV